MRTIGAADALTRVGQFVPGLDNSKASWAHIFDVRNGIVHGGVHLPINDSLLVPFFSTCDDILRALSIGDREAFWGDFLSLVEAHLRDYMEIAKIAAAEALATARSQFSHRYDSMSPTASREAIAAIERAYIVEKYLQSLTKCPACGYTALASGSYEVTWAADWEYGDDAPTDDRGLIVTFSPGSLKCRVCDLRLSGKDELVASGVPDAWRIEDADEADFRDEAPEWP